MYWTQTYCCCIRFSAQLSLIIDVEPAPENHTEIDTGLKIAVWTDRTTAQTLLLMYTRSLARFFSRLEMQNMINRQGVSLQSFVENSCKVPAQTPFTYPDQERDQATLNPLNGNYIFDEAEATFTSTIDKDNSACHSVFQRMNSSIVTTSQLMKHRHWTEHYVNNRSKPGCQLCIQRQSTTMRREATERR